MTATPPSSASRRAVPRNLTEPQRERLRALLDDPETWVLRPGWLPYLLHGDHGTLVDTEELTRDQRVAAVAWLRQQRHALFHALEGGTLAPQGWLESLPLYKRLVG